MYTLLRLQDCYCLAKLALSFNCPVKDHYTHPVDFEGLSMGIGVVHRDCKEPNRCGHGRDNNRLHQTYHILLYVIFWRLLFLLVHECLRRTLQWSMVPP